MPCFISCSSLLCGLVQRLRSSQAAGLLRLIVNHACVQLSGEGLLPFTTDKQTAFGYAVFTALGNLTSLFTVNVSDYTVGSSTRQNR